MDDTTASIITENRLKLGAWAHQLYLDFIHLGIALLPTRRYEVTYTVKSRHLWESDGGISCQATGTTLEAAVAACVTAHQQANRTQSDFQVAWYAELNLRQGVWQRTMAVNPAHYQALIPGGQFDSGLKTAEGRPLLATA